MAEPRSRHHGNIDDILEAWPEEPREIAEDMIDEYGRPEEAAPSRLIWHENGPWKRTELYRDGVPHDFPKPHTDYLEQYIDYNVPPEKADELTTFDGSVMIERTKGEMSARCDQEPMNFLALNLAHDIVTGETDVDEARQDYAITAMKEMMGGSPEYTSQLQFTPTGRQGDPDEEIVDEVTESGPEGEGTSQGHPGREGIE